MSKKMVRVVLDAALTVMLVFEMFIQYTGNFLHEVIGFALFATVVVHLTLSAKWMKSTARATKAGRLSGRNAALAIMGCLLAVDMVILGVSSVAISQIIASTGFVWTLGTYATWATIHAVSSYALCALVVVHLAMHWAFLFNVLKVPYNPERRRAIGVGVHAAAAVGAVALGVMAAREALPQTIAVAQETTSDANAGESAGAASKNNGNTFDKVSDLSQNSSSSSTSGSANTSSSSSSNSSGSSSAASSSSKRSKKSKPNSRSGQVNTTSNTSSKSGSNSNTNSQPTTDTTQDPEPNTISTQDTGADSSETPTVSGICTLCRKQCPLSAPRCNRPYEEGLI